MELESEFFDAGGLLDVAKGVAYRARQISLDRWVALKIIQGGRAASPEAAQRFHTEARATAKLDHPNIVPIYETGEIDGQYL